MCVVDGGDDADEAELDFFGLIFFVIENLFYFGLLL